MAVPAPAAGSDVAAMQRRLQELETELKRRPDPAQTTRLIELANLKERVRALEEANRADQQRIFDTYRKYGAVSDPTTRATLNREVGDIQLQMARRGQEQRTLREQIGEFEKETGPPAAQDAPQQK
jgi:hypothetical protein